MPALKTWVGVTREGERDRDAEREIKQVTPESMGSRAPVLMSKWGNLPCRIGLSPRKSESCITAPTMRPPLYSARKKSTLRRCPEVWLLKSPEQQIKIGYQFVWSLINVLEERHPGLVGLGTREQHWVTESNRVDVSSCLIKRNLTMSKDPDRKGQNKHFRYRALFAILHPSKSSRMKAWA